MSSIQEGIRDLKTISCISCLEDDDLFCGNNAPELAGRVRSEPIYVLMRQIKVGKEIVETKIDIRRGD